MKHIHAKLIIAGLAIMLYAGAGCKLVQKSSKYNFNDGVYRTKQFSKNKVYVLHVDDDTIAVFPVRQFGDSSAVLTKERMNYTANQYKFKDHKTSHTFYRPSLDLDLITIPLKYRFAEDVLPNTLTTNFNGALFAGYRIDAYRLNYQRTPLNSYKQTVKHLGYSVGLLAGLGSAMIDNSSLSLPSYSYQYEGVLLITGVALNVAIDNITIGIAYGMDYLQDKHRDEWIYEGKPCLGFTLGLDLN